jgi:hypothetical protein
MKDVEEDLDTLDAAISQFKAMPLPLGEGFSLLYPSAWKFRRLLWKLQVGRCGCKVFHSGLGRGGSRVKALVRTRCRFCVSGVQFNYGFRKEREEAAKIRQTDNPLVSTNTHGGRAGREGQVLRL